MPKKTVFLSLIVIVSLIISCQKSVNKATSPINTDTTVSLTGTWNIESINVLEITDYAAMQGLVYDSVAATASYTMTTLTGNLQFTSDSLYVLNLSYSKDTTYSGVEYTNGVFDSTENDAPLHVSLDSTSVAFPSLQVSGQDSLNFPQGGMTYAGLGLPVPLTPKGATYTINGNTMLMYMNADTAAYNPSGPGSAFLSSHLMLTLQKQ